MVIIHLQLMYIYEPSLSHYVNLPLKQDEKMICLKLDFHLANTKIGWLKVMLTIVCSSSITSRVGAWG